MRALDQKGVLITGAASGIGEAAATVFAREGARVYLVDRNGGALESLAAQLGSACGGFAVADVADSASTEAFFASAITSLGGLDVALLNAGIGGGQLPIMDDTLDNFRGVIEVNLQGMWLGLKHAMKAMKARGGSIIVTSSINSFRGAPGLAPYVASKHGAIGLVKTAALEGAPFNIRVNAVNPGPVDTPLTNAALASIENDAQRQTILDKMVQAIPLKLFASANDVAQMMLFLASDASSYVTGSQHVVDGGLTENSATW